MESLEPYDVAGYILMAIILFFAIIFSPFWVPIWVVLSVRKHARGY